MKRTSAKSALFASVISLVLCISMLVGTTFAWFTDTESSGTSSIVAGSLDVNLYHENAVDAFEQVTPNINLFDEVAYWEPGVSVYENFTVKNEGDLALAFELEFALSNVTNVSGHYFSEVLEYAVVLGGKITSADDVANILFKPLADFSLVDSLLAGEEATYGIVIRWRNSDIDDVFNMNDANQNKTVGFDISALLTAVQKSYENDSFGSSYDADALLCDVLATPKTIDAILAGASEGDVIGLAAGKYGTITMPTDGITVVTNSAVVDFVDFNGRANCRIDGITFDAAGAKEVIKPNTGVGIGLYANVAGTGTFVSRYASNASITNCTFAGTPADADNFVSIALYERSRPAGGIRGITVDNCSFETEAAYYVYAYYPGRGTGRFTNNTFGTTERSATNAIYWGNAQGGASLIGNTFINCTVTLTGNSAYKYTVLVDSNNFINTGDTDYVGLGYRNMFDSTVTIKNNVANFGTAALGAPYVDTQNYTCYEIPAAADTYKVVSTADELTEAVANAVDGTTIAFANDIVGDSIALQKADIDVTIDGNGYAYTGTIYLHGQARHTGAETLTIQNINFKSDVADDFIDANSTKSAERYAHNVTVKDCTFVGSKTADVVALRLRQTYNIKVENCQAADMHSLLWATGANGLTVDGVTLLNSKNGISVGTSNGVVVKNSEIVAAGDYSYGIRADASGAYTLTVTNCKISADAPVLLRKASGAYTLTVDGGALATTDAYQIIVTAGDYEDGKALTAPTGAVTVNGADGLEVFK